MSIVRADRFVALREQARRAAAPARLGVAARLLIAFLGISGLAVVGAAVAIYSFREIGHVLDRITADRVPAALSSQEVSRQTERIVSAAPALFAAATTAEHAEQSARIAAEGQALTTLLERLERGGGDGAALVSMRTAVDGLRANLAAIDALVADRIVLSDRKRSHVRNAVEGQAEGQRLLAPWLQIVDGQIAQSRRVVGNPAIGADERAAAGSRLVESTTAYSALQRVELLVTFVSDRLQQIAGAYETDGVRVHVFRIQQALAEARQLTTGLDTRLRPLLTTRLEQFQTQVEGSDSIAALRLQELALDAQATTRLAENAALSRELTAAADRLVAGARQDIAKANADALTVRRFSSMVLIAAVALSLLSSVLIVWLYVGRSIVRRLSALSSGMLAIAGGKLDAAVAAQGKDEIAAMGRAVEVFRRNAIELEGLLEERKRTAEHLEEVVEARTRELERRSSVLRVTFDHMGHGVVMFDKDRRMVAWNNRFRELLDLPDDLVGPDITFETFLRRLADRGEYGRGDVDELIQRRLLSLDRPFVDERTRPNGTILQIRRNPVRGGGFVSIYADVTEERRAQELVELARARLTDAIESITDGFALWDKDDRLVIVNSHCEELLEAADLFVVGTHFEDILRAINARGQVDPTQGGGSQEWIAMRLAIHRSGGGCETRLSNGRWLHIREFRTREAGTVTIWTDITATKAREQELETARDAAAEASRTAHEAYAELKTTQTNLIHAEKMASLGQLTAGIAHEIKNPLNFVNNFAGLSDELLRELKDGLAPALRGLDANALADVEDLMATLTGNLSKIAEHGRRADGIVRSMLLHSRGGSGERQSVNLNALIEEALNLAYHGARAQDQTFNITLERDLDQGIAPIELVPQDITRVFLNIFGNGFYAAQKRQREGAGPEFRPVLRVSSRDTGGQVEIRVRDNGVGMTPEVREKLFTPFFTTKPTGEGTGLGLSISYDIIVQQHGGSITVDSRPGEFTEFLIRVPRGTPARRRVPQNAMGERA
jgi:signal transduction histidine kinase